MNNLLTYKLFLEGQIQDYTNELLDKISELGIDSLTEQEREFLDSHKTGTQEETLKKIQNEFEDEIGKIKVKFIYKGSEPGDEPFLNHYGTLILNDGVQEFVFEGSMSEYNGGFTTMFENEDISDWDIFLNEGLSQEYEQYLELILGELENNYKLIQQ